MFIFTDLKLNLPSPIEQISSPELTERKIKLYVKRDDLIHPELTGNKWRKLKYNLLQARQDNHQTLLTFGGAYSNHIHAVAAAGNLLGFKTIGVIRGERVVNLSPTLAYAESQGMHLHFVSREAYRNKTEIDFVNRLKDEFGDFYLIPEGGSNSLALKGVTEIVDELDVQLPQANYICCACGTGGTLAGLILASAEKNINILGFPVLKNADWMYQDILKLLGTDEVSNWSLNLNYHFGGYAKYDKKLIDFIQEFKKQFSIQLEPIYTAKMLFGLFDLIKNDYFPENSVIVALHTGGLQGLKGIKEFKNEKF